MVQNASTKWHQHRPGFKIKRQLTLIICLSMLAKTWFLFQGQFISKNRELQVKVQPVSIANAFDCLIAFQSALRPLQPQWFDEKLPVLTSVVPSNNGATMKVIFSLKENNKDGEYETWSTAKWSCGKEVAEVIGFDQWKNVLIIECPAQTQLDITANATQRSVSATYSSLPTPCWFEFTPSELAACTMMKGSPRDLIPEWVSYHSLIGFEHFYIYVNEAWNAEYDRLKEELGNRVSWIPYDMNVHNKSFLFQQAMQNDCVHRAQNQVNWMSLHDVDEYFQILTPHKSLPPLLEELEASVTSIGGIRMKNWFCGNKDEVQGNSSMFLLDRYTWKTPSETKGGREKMIVHPHNVQYVTVHRLTLGGRMVIPNAKAIVRMNHYKLAWEGVFGYDLSEGKKKFGHWGLYPEKEKYRLVKDTSMRKYVPEMKAFLQSHD